VLGSAGLLNDVVVYVLSQSGVPLCRGRQVPEDGPVVAVLVEPAAADWEAARTAGVPVVVVVEPELDEERRVALVLRGAEAIIDTDRLSSTVGRVLEVVAGGGSDLTPSQSRALAQLARKAAAGDHSRALTTREREIIASIAAGDSVKQTALALGISAKTVENLQSRLFRKLGVRNRAQAVARAHALGLLTPAN
jgi:DNA-binding NarL/FixJ family response regulator